ncbi:MarR family winged helix-turn-helix transcriptional regulator [Alphaproteobacteria bacterium]|nr:MarR family winged helix-turn-helix transcriptional regulator [Alphaproteobacteria bacterium]
MDRNLTVNERHELRVLELVGERDRITQRGVATELEIALGMANALVKRLVHKGYIKVKDAPSRRYKYYITPEGFAEKGRLVSKYIANSFKFFGEVRRDYEMLASQVFASQVSTSQGTGVCCVGTGEVMEIAQLVFAAHNIEVVCVLDVLADEGEQHFQNFRDIPDEIASQIGCLVITETRRPHKVFEILASTEGNKEILAPAFMKINKSNFQLGRV